MKINKAELEKALEIVKPGLAKKEHIEQTTSFAFYNGRVFTFNDEISISHPVNLDVEGAVKAEELYKLLKKIKKEEVDITCTDNELLLGTGKTRSGFALEEKIMLPIKETDIKEWKDLPELFVDGLNYTKETTSKDMTNAKLTCVHIIDDGSVESSDKLRYSWFKFADEFDMDVLIPETTVRHVVKYPIDKVAQSDAWIHFGAGETVISCRIYAGDFPDARSNIEAMTGDGITFPLGLGEVLDRAYVFSKRDIASEEEAEIKIESGKVIVTAKNSFGWFEEYVDMDVETDKAVTFCVNPEFLKSILEKSEECVVNERMIKFTGSNWLHAVALRSYNAN